MKTTKTTSLHVFPATLLAFAALSLAACDQKPAPAPTETTGAAASAPAASAAAAKPAETAEPAAAAAVPPSEPGAWTIDTSHSKVGFSVKHMMVSNTRGEFKKFTGKIYLDEKDLAKTTVEVEIDVASVDTNEPKRDEHLKSPDFFDAKAHPKMTFKSTKVEKDGAGYKVTGDLTLHGVTKPAVLKVDPLTAEAKDPWGGTRRGTRATTKIDRKDFGLTWNKALETGGALVGDEVTIELDVELVKAKAQ